MQYAAAVAPGSGALSVTIRATANHRLEGELVHISARKLAVPIVMALTALAVFVSPAFAQSGPSSEWTAPAVSSTTAIPLSPTTNRCVNSGHTVPCWAVTKNPSGANHFGCNPSGSDPVPFFHRDGSFSCIRSNELVEISCWFTDADGIEDHVIQEDGGGQKIPGHIPDVFIDLHNQNPGDVGIGLC